MELRGQLSSCLFCAILLAAIPFSEFKNGERLREKGKKRVRFSIPETPEQNTETSEEITETFEKNTEKMAEANLDEQKILVGTIVVLIVIIIIGIVFFIYYCLRNRRRDPEKGTLISAKEGRGVGWRQSQDDLQAELKRVQKGKDELQAELKRVQKGKEPRVVWWPSQERLQRENDEFQADLRRTQEERDKLQAELKRLQRENDEFQADLNELQAELNWRRAYKYADDITLDAGTAHPNLSIAGDYKSLKHETQPQKVPPNPERFDSTVCVLGSEGFSSGKHYWEVDIMSSTDWDLGVARKSIERKGKLSLSPKEGFWALGLNGKDYWAKTDPWTRVMVQKKPKKIGVYLSYQDKQVTFFSVTDMSVLFTFNDCSFSGAVYPFFKNSHKETAMRICSISEDQ